MDTGGRCYDLEFEASNLIIACHDGIRKYTLYNGFKTILAYPHVTSAGQAPGRPGCLHFTRESSENTQGVNKYDNESPTKPLQAATLFEYELEESYAVFMKTSDTLIAVSIAEHLIIFDLNTKIQNRVEIGFYALHIHFLSSNLLLATGPWNTLHLFKISSDSQSIDIEKIWTTTDLPGAHGVCVSSNGLIVVKSSIIKAFFILSPRGEF